MRTVTVSANGKLYEITTRADTVEGALAEAGIVLSADNELNYSLDSDLDDVSGIITISNPVILQVNLVEAKVGGAGIDADVSVDIANGMPETDVYTPSEPVSIPGDEVVIKSTKIVEEQEELSFETVYVDDNTMYEGDSEVVSEGRKGLITRTYEVSLEDGVEVSRTLISEDRVEPQNKVIAIGTKVYFLNSRGLTENFTTEYVMTATAYAPTPENYGYATASGNRARDGVVAVDPRVIPLGTKLYVKSNVEGVPDYGYCIAWDVGGAIKNMRIDLFMESIKACGEFGSRSVTVYVLEDQSIDVFALR